MSGCCGLMLEQLLGKNGACQVRHDQHRLADFYHAEDFQDVVVGMPDATMTGIFSQIARLVCAVQIDPELV